MYFTDRGIEELEKRRGEEDVTLAWLAERLRDFVDLNPEFETPIERFATWLAGLDDLDEDLTPAAESAGGGRVSRCGRPAPDRYAASSASPAGRRSVRSAPPGPAPGTSTA